MYKVITSLWSKPTSANKSHSSSESLFDEESWVFVSDNGVLLSSSSRKNNNPMTNSWIASPPLIKTDESPANVHHFNPIENLLIEHASMSVYEQLAPKTRRRRHRETVNDDKLEEQAEEVEKEEEDDADHKGSAALQHPNLTSVQYRNLNISSNSSITTLESSTSSLVAHRRHLHRRHQRRKRSHKSSSKSILTNSVDESKQIFNKNIERQRLNHTRAPKIYLQQPSHSNH